jgi:hypothetical protein
MSIKLGVDEGILSLHNSMIHVKNLHSHPNFAKAKAIVMTGSKDTFI